MSGWRQAVFIRQRRIDVIQRALSKVLDEEAWSPATPRRLRVGSADASSRGWTMIVSELANFFLDRGGPGSSDAPRLCRLARELRCPAYEVDVRDGAATTLLEVDALGQPRRSGAPLLLPTALLGDGDAEPAGLEIASALAGAHPLAIPDAIPDRIRALDRTQPMALADYLGAIAGFPGWTSHGDDATTAGELIYEPPRTTTRARDTPHGRAYPLAGLRAQPPETREAIARTKPRAVLPAHDRRGRRPRSAGRPRR